MNLGLLGYFKYRNLLVETAGLAIGADWHLPPLVLPLAISFFTFEQITYLVDAYHDDTGEYDFLSYGLFITFFPHLIAGPIVRFKELVPQFTADEMFRLSPNNLSNGLLVFAIGLFKKVIIADTFSAWVGPIFDHAPAVVFSDAWGATVAYALQLYFDFSGYTDMAIGLALMLNIVLPENFDSPYKAQSIIDFWRRWHMTLSNFLRDYLYIPLGGNRAGPRGATSISSSRCSSAACGTAQAGPSPCGAGCTASTWRPITSGDALASGCRPGSPGPSPSSPCWWAGCSSGRHPWNARRSSWKGWSG